MSGDCALRYLWRFKLRKVLLLLGRMWVEVSDGEMGGIIGSDGGDLFSVGGIFDLASAGSFDDVWGWTLNCGDLRDWVVEDFRGWVVEVLVRRVTSCRPV